MDFKNAFQIGQAPRKAQILCQQVSSEYTVQFSFIAWRDARQLEQIFHPQMNHKALVLSSK
jgi:hypothetical protein